MKDQVSLSDKTKFLPFNKDIANPVNNEGHKVSYLWEEIFQKFHFI